MLGIDNAGIEHRLCADPSCKKVQQKRRSFSIEKYVTIAKEVDHLPALGFIREAHYPEWLSNIILVKKASGKWRMYVDFTDLNKTCLKDSSSLPQVDVIVDSTAGHHVISFMDPYLVCNQICMNPADEEKMSFIMEKGLYCY